MKVYLNKIKKLIAAHKIISAIGIILLLLLGNWGYGKITSTTGETRYVLSKVKVGTIVSTITGSGQVSALSQIDLKPTVSGLITYIGVKPGDQVVAGKNIFAINSKDAERAVRDADLSLKSAQITLSKLQISNSPENLNSNLTKAYDDGFSAISDTFLDLPPTITGLGNLFGERILSDNSARNSGTLAVNYRNSASDAYDKANNAYNTNRTFFATLDRSSSAENLDKAIEETYQTTKLLSSAIKSLRDFTDYMAKDTNSSAYTPLQDTLATYTNTITSHLNSILSAQTSINNYKDSVPSSALDIQSAELSVKQKENALQDAKDKLADYYIRAPFSGTIASVPVQKGDNVGPSTTLGTIITTQKIATISLNEVDIAKIQLGQKVTLTFDAIADLTLTGQVAQIDSIGTVSQGVVNYNVKISFDTNDDRIKPGMSASAAVITDVKQDVLTIPNSAVKKQGGMTYVEIFDTPLPTPITGVQGSPSLTPPRRQEVTIGTSNDTSTEIISGLKDGDEVVSRTILPTTTSTTAPSIFGAATNKNSAGGAVRIPTGR